MDRLIPAFAAGLLTVTATVGARTVLDSKLEAQEQAEAAEKARVIDDTEDRLSARLSLSDRVVPGSERSTVCGHIDADESGTALYHQLAASAREQVRSIIAQKKTRRVEPSHFDNRSLTTVVDGVLVTCVIAEDISDQPVTWNSTIW